MTISSARLLRWPVTASLLPVLLLAAPVYGATPHSSVEAALSAASTSGKRILVHFSDEDSELAAYHTKLFSTPDFERVLEARYEFAVLEFKNNSKIATTLSVSRAGTIMIYDTKGTYLGDVKERMPTPDLLRKLRELGGEIVRGAGGPGSATGAESGSAPGAVANLKNAQSMIPVAPAGTEKGVLVAGPIRVNANDDKPKKIAHLEKGKPYVLEVEGTVSLWRAFPQPGADVMFRYQKGREPMDPPRKLQSLGLTTGAGDTTMHGLISRQTGAEPAYNPKHRYAAGITGEGKDLRAYVRDSSFDDNTGAFMVSIYEGK